MIKALVKGSQGLGLCVRGGVVYQLYGLPKLQWNNMEIFTEVKKIIACYNLNGGQRSIKYVKEITKSKNTLREKDFDKNEFQWWKKVLK